MNDTKEERKVEEQNERDREELDNKLPG